MKEEGTEVGVYKRKQESKKKKERKHALDQESDQENDQGKKKVFRLVNMNHFYFQPLTIVPAICRFEQIE